MIEPFYFGEPDESLFGVLNRASPGAASDRGVVICGPLGYENVIYYRQLAVLARRLADDGRSTLRFDWPGAGDSVGDDTRPGLVRAYLAAVQLAVDALRARTGVVHVDLIGLRVGATLGAAAVASGAAVEDLVLWDPFLTGRSYLRTMRSFDRLSRRPSEEQNGSEPAGQPASGFVISPSTMAELEQLDLTALEYGSPRRVLLAGRDVPPEEPFGMYLRGLGHEVTCEVFDELREVALGWAERPVPTASFERIESWLTPGAPSGEAEGRPESKTSMRLSVDGVAIQEEAVVLEGEGAMLGIVATPVEGTLDDSWVLFVPNRYARRIGPNRLYTGWARSWAARGCPSLRVDVNGTGDAGGPDEETDRDMYRQDAVVDLVHVVSYLRERFGARRFAVMGLCSGGYIGFHAALREAAIDDVILLNPQMLLWTDQETPLTHAGLLRRAAFQPSTWKRFVASPERRARVAAVAPVVREAVSSALQWQIRRLLPGPEGREASSTRAWITGSLARLAGRDCRLLFVFSEGDAGMQYLERHLGPDLTGLAESPNISLETVADADHTFRDAGRQAVLRDLLERHLAANGFSVRAS